MPLLLLLLYAALAAATNPTVFLPTPPLSSSSPPSSFTTFRRPIYTPSLGPSPSPASSPSPCYTAAPLSLPWPRVNDICTSTLTTTISPLPASPFWPECAHRPTSTLYAATTTVVASLDCAGCNAIHVTAVPEVRCPQTVARPGTTVMLDDTTSTTLTVCSLTARSTA